MAKFYEIGYELLPHPPYAPDLAQSDNFLFPIFARTNAYYEDFDEYYSMEGSKNLEKRRRRVWSSK